jgi:outer membrane protein TolC
MIRRQHIFPVPVLPGLVLLILCPSVSGRGQTGPSAAATSPQNPFLGSVPTGQATATTLSLSLKEAFDRALKYNLGVIESDQNTRLARAARLRNLSALLPNISARLSATIQQINLAALGLSPHQFPGIPTIVGPFSVADARGYLSQQVFNWSDLKSWKSSREAERVSVLAYKSDRDLVILVTGNAYLQVISDGATVDSDRAQVKTAQTLYDQAVDQSKAGVIASIDLLRAKVQLQTQQQSLIAAENQLAIDKLTLARVTGLPTGQDFQLTDSVPYAPLSGITLEEALKQAYETRPDYLSAKAQVRSAELARQAAAAENYPTLSLDTNYGDIGSPNFAQSHGTFIFAGTLNVPLFQGTQVRAAKLQADALLQQRKAELESLRGSIDDQVRTALFDLKSSAELVAVAKSNIDLANQTLTQAQDRFAAGVADNLSVVQAQQSVASANQSYIASLYSFNLAKISLAQAIGIAEQSALQYLGVR